jgi:hypothetical protein
MTTNLNYPKPVKPDDGCNWLPVILWRMNAGARARSRSVFVAAHARNQSRHHPAKTG